MNADPIAEPTRFPVLPEPRPVRALTELAAYPWFVICLACLGAFAGQVDASIVQLALPDLEFCFQRLPKRGELGCRCL